MSEEESSGNESAPPLVFRMRVEVPGEPGVYNLKFCVPDDLLNTPGVDYADHVIDRMAKEVRRYRQVQIYGKCSTSGCKLPRAPRYLSNCTDLCEPEDRALHRASTPPRWPSGA